jgi:hypothetical protein
MQNSLSRKFLCATIAGAFLTACAGSGSSGVPNAGSSLGAAQSPFVHNDSTIALSGGYTGKVRLTGSSASRLELVMSQAQNALGGLLGTSGSSGVPIALAVNGNQISGSFIIPSASGYCTFSMTGTYKHRRLSGSLRATYGCTGDTGTFNFWHKCYFQGTGSEAIRPETGVRPC